MTEGLREVAATELDPLSHDGLKYAISCQFPGGLRTQQAQCAVECDPGHGICRRDDAVPQAFPRSLDRVRASGRRHDRPFLEQGSPTSHQGLSPRAAGQLFDVLGKGLGTELEPLDHSQVRKKLISDVLYRHPGTQGHDRRLNELAGFAGHGLGPRAGARCRVRRRS